MKVVLFQQYNLLETLQGDLHTLYAKVLINDEAAAATNMYVEDGFVWVDVEGEGLPELLLLASTEKLVKVLQASVVATIAGANENKNDDVTAVTGETENDDVDILSGAVDKISLELEHSSSKDHNGNQKETDEKVVAAEEGTDEKDSGDVDEAEAEIDDSPVPNETAESSQKDVDENGETAEKDHDKSEETDVDEKEAGDDALNEKETDKVKDPTDTAGSGTRSKNSKKKAQQKKNPAEDLPFQKLQRVNDLDDLMRVALEDIRAMKQRDYSSAKKKKGDRDKRLSRDDQRLAAMEHKRRRLHEQLTNDNVTNASGDSSPEDSDRENPWIRLVRVLNSIRLLAQILPPILLHERRNDKSLHIGNAKLQIKRNAPCWLLGEHVFDMASGKMCKSNYNLLNEIFAYYFGMPADFEVTVESTLWREPLEQMMKTAVQQRSRSDEVTKAPWIDIDPLECLDATRVPALEKLTLELDEKHLADTAGEDPEQHRRYLKSVTTLHERISLMLKQRFPTSRLSIYGSCLSDLSLAKSSDVDLSLYLDRADSIRNSFELGNIPVAKYEKEMKGMVYEVCRKLEARRDEFCEMVPVARARVPVVKGRFLKAENPHAPDGSLHFDICFLNDIAVANSSLVREYSLVDQRVKQLMIAVKRWAKANNISSAQDNSLSSYAWMNMVIFYVQCVGIVPNLQDPKLLKKAGVTPDPEGNEWHRVNNLDTCFLTWEQASAVWTPPDSPHRSATALLYGFFRFYARDFPCSLFAISMKRGRDSLIPKTSLQKCLVFYCIEDPFETFDSHCPHDLGTPAGEVGTKRLVQCIQKAELYCREILLASLGEDATRPTITSLWPAPVEKAARKVDNSPNNQNNGRNGNGRGGRGSPQKQPQNQANGRGGRGSSQKQPQNQAKVNTKQEQPAQKQPQNQAKDNTKQEQPKSQKEGNTKGTVQPQQSPEDRAKQEQQKGKSQAESNQKKKRNTKPKPNPSQQPVVVVMDEGVAVATNGQANNASSQSQSGSSRGKARKPRNIPKPKNTNQRSGRGGRGEHVFVVTQDQGNTVVNAEVATPPMPSNGNQQGGRGGRGGRSRARNRRSSPKSSDQVSGQSNQEPGSNAPADNA